LGEQRRQQQRGFSPRLSGNLSALRIGFYYPFIPYLSIVQSQLSLSAKCDFLI